MKKFFIFNFQNSFTRMIMACVLGVFLGALGVYFFVPFKVVEAPAVAQSNESTSAFARSAPIEITIPKIGLDADFVAPLGLNDDKTVSVPDTYTEVGWYRYGATPGEVGTAVILGHVDSYKGPAVFYKLGQLQKNDEIHIKRADGTTAVFIVDELQRYTRDSFPTELVYKMTDTPTLRLITCTGVFDHGKQLYSHNLVVYASLAPNQNQN